MPGCAAARADRSQVAVVLASIQRPQLFAVLFIALSLNGLATKIVLAIGRGWFEASLSLLGINAIVWAALAALIAIAAGQGEREPIRRSDWFVAAIALLCALAPVTALSGAMLVIASGWLAWSSRPRNRSWRIALIALALTGRVFWGKLALGLFGGTIATLETRIVPLLTGLQTDGNVMTAFDGSKTFVVAASCSSVANLSLVVILMVTAILALAITRSRRLLVRSVRESITAEELKLRRQRLDACGYAEGDHGCGRHRHGRDRLRSDLTLEVG